MRVLVIDNDETMQRLVLRIVGREGWRGVTAANDMQALAAFRPRRFGVAIIDVDLDAGLDGIDLAKILLNLDPALPVIMISGDPLNEARVRRVGLAHFLAKPFQLESITSVLKKIARRT